MWQRVRIAGIAKELVPFPVIFHTAKKCPGLKTPRIHKCKPHVALSVYSHQMPSYFAYEHGEAAHAVAPNPGRRDNQLGLHPVQFEPIPSCPPSIHRISPTPMQTESLRNSRIELVQYESMACGNFFAKNRVPHTLCESRHKHISCPQPHKITTP